MKIETAYNGIQLNVLSSTLHLQQFKK